jgi:hypothetical protein
VVTVYTGGILKGERMGKREAAGHEQEQYVNRKTTLKSRRNGGQRIYATDDEKC